MHAYSDLYLRCAQLTLASMLQYAVYDAQIELTEFYDMFLRSRFSTLFAHGDPTAIAGRSGIELARDVVQDVTARRLDAAQVGRIERSPEYWAGYVLAYYQWYSGLSFQGINRIIAIDELVSMYFPYHEMDIMRTVEYLENRRHSTKTESRLRAYRTALGFSQSELATLTDIPVKSIQNLEQGQKSISKLRVDYCVRLSRALHCDIEMLVEE